MATHQAQSVFGHLNSLNMGLIEMMSLTTLNWVMQKSRRKGSAFSSPLTSHSYWIWTCPATLIHTKSLRCQWRDRRYWYPVFLKSPIVVLIQRLKCKRSDHQSLNAANAPKVITARRRAISALETQAKSSIWAVRAPRSIRGILVQLGKLAKSSSAQPSHAAHLRFKLWEEKIYSSRRRTRRLFDRIWPWRHKVKSSQTICYKSGNSVAQSAEVHPRNARAWVGGGQPTSRSSEICWLIRWIASCVTRKWSSSFSRNLLREKNVEWWRKSLKTPKPKCRRSATPNRKQSSRALRSSNYMRPLRAQARLARVVESSPRAKSVAKLLKRAKCEVGRNKKSKKMKLSRSESKEKRPKLSGLCRHWPQTDKDSTMQDRKEN